MLGRAQRRRFPEQSMIAYVTMGTNDLPRAARFYDELFTLLNAKRVWEMDRSIGWSTSPDAPAVSVIKPYDGGAASVGNGYMVALAASSKAEVDALYRKALELGAKDEGAAGPRGDHYYAGYFRDLDGNKVAVFFEGAAG
jgi:catechol 2,3-dioxygenase-like lactoylglutathione lyase family enzyme